MADQCYVCGKLPLISREDQVGETLVYRAVCRRCGTYSIAQKLISGDKQRTFLAEIERVRLSHAIRKATDAHGLFGEVVLEFETVKALADRHPLPDPVERGDLLIASVAQRAEYGERTPNEHGETWAARIGMKDSSQVGQLAAELEKLVSMSLLQSGEVNFKLLLDGWTRANEIYRHRSPGNQAFVAMWFHSDMDAAFDDGFSPALEETGFQPYRVDRDAHNNKIDDQIIAQLRRSKLVIVDSTGARPNAYYEAGFAAGLGVPVIWCCSASPTAPGLSSGSWTDNLPFDIRQHSFTFWSDPPDLRKKLTARVRALGYDAAWNRGQ